MPQTRINCPNCRQPIVAEIEQLVDINIDPAAKQRLLSGVSNFAACPNCGYRGNISTPIVYHDPDKELLLTFFPPEANLPRDQQEKLLGQLINQAISKLPQEKRKGYLLRPQTMLTYQGLVERILEADGVTKEMLQASQQKVSLLQRLMSATEEVRLELLNSEDKLIDAEFFTLLSRLVEAAMASGDRQSAQKLADLQKLLLPNTTFGKQVQEQSQEVQTAMNDLRAMGEQITREKLLELVVNAPNPTRVSALASLARPVMDYEFFRLLSERIDRARSDGRQRLIDLREMLLELTRQIDQQLTARATQSRQVLEALLKAKDVRKATMEILPAIDEFFLGELNNAMETARKQADLERIGKLNQIVEVLQQASQPGEDMSLLEDLIDAQNEGERRKLLEANKEKITAEFLDSLNNLVVQVEQGQDAELTEQVKAVHRQVLRYSMEMQLSK
jgi:hypothetical protein